MRLYRLLLRLYPASFRADYSDEMTAIFRARLRDANRLGRVAVWLTACQEVLMSAPVVHWEILKQDLRYTVRTLLRTRTFALTVILVTALGVGANTAAFSVADFVLFRPLPFADPEALVHLCEGPRTGGGWGCMNELSPANYRDFKTMSSSFSAMGAFNVNTANLVGIGDPRRLEVASVTPDVLPLLGVNPLLGRVFEARAEDENAVVLEYGFWQSQFGADRSVVGRTINLNGAPHTIVGVMPPSFYFPSRGIQMWDVLTFRNDDFADRTNTYLHAVARMKQGIAFEQARADLDVIAARLSHDFPQTNAETGISFFRVRENMAPRTRVMLIALGAASLCLLLLTCANLASLMLARAAARARELAVRAAIGAGRERLIRQLITESVVLALLGGSIGVVVALVGVPLFSSLVPTTLPLADRPVLDLRMFGFAALFTAVTGVGFGVLPAIRAGRGTGFSALREGNRTGGGRQQRVRAVLVTIEVTMSVILLITSGLLIRAVWRVQAVDPGLNPQNVLTLRTALTRPKYDDVQRRQDFYQRVLAGVRVLPGVQSAAFINGLPMIMTGIITGVEIPGQEVRSRRRDGVSHRWITSQYFQTMGIPLLRGRDVEERDTRDRQWVAIVSSSFATHYWPGQDPIGKTFRHLGQTRTVVGIVGDVRVRGLERTNEPQMYLPASQVDKGSPPIFDPRDLVIRHSGSGEMLVSAIRQIVSEIDSEQPVSDVRTMDDVLARETAGRRGQLHVLGSLAVVAVLLSTVGIYGLLSYTVAQRSQEIGVRLALGANGSRVARMIFTDGIRLAMFGIGPGVLVAYGAARGMSSLLFGIAPEDPATFTIAVAVTVLTTIGGSLVPALRATRVAPMTVLRAE